MCWTTPPFSMIQVVLDLRPVAQWPFVSYKGSTLGLLMNRIQSSNSQPPFPPPMQSHGRTLGVQQHGWIHSCLWCPAIAWPHFIIILQKSGTSRFWQNCAHRKPLICLTMNLLNGCSKIGRRTRPRANHVTNPFCNRYDTWPWWADFIIIIGQRLPVCWPIYLKAIKQEEI